jgi:hypothetical protein
VPPRLTAPLFLSFRDIAVCRVTRLFPLSRQLAANHWQAGPKSCQLDLEGENLAMTEFGSTTGSGPPYREKRTVPRYSFIATVELVEPVSDVHMSGRVSEISRKGCYVDILNTLPVATRINLWISCDQGTFFTPARIIYVQEGMGMGVAFVDPSADQLKILDTWLADLQK